MKESREFTKFRREFQKYQKRFGLNGYEVYFKYEPLEGVFADITTSLDKSVVTCRLNSALPAKDKQLKDIHGTAKHEAIHLLLEEVAGAARNRYVREEELEGAVERTVVKLAALIPD